MELFTAAVTSRESAGQPYTVVKLSGEADITVSGKLWDTLDAEVSRQPGRLIIDLSALRFMDSSALHVILAVSKTLAARGGAMALADPQRPVSTVRASPDASRPGAGRLLQRGRRGSRLTRPPQPEDKPPARKDHSHRKTARPARGRAVSRQRGVRTSRGVVLIPRAIGSLGRDPA
jgi:anti-anti-sigma factor